MVRHEAISPNRYPCIHPPNILRQSWIVPIVIGGKESLLSMTATLGNIMRVACLARPPWRSLSWFPLLKFILASLPGRTYQTPQHPPIRFFPLSIKLTVTLIRVVIGIESAQSTSVVSGETNKHTTFMACWRFRPGINESSQRKSARDYGAEYVMLPGAAHNLMMEKSQRQTIHKIHSWLGKNLGWCCHFI